MANVTVQLIVNADDCGYCPQRDAGILHAIDHGVVSSGSLLVNGLHAIAMVQALRDRQKSHILGLHINLTEGLPVSKPSDIPSLVISRGECSVFRGKQEFREALRSGEINLGDIRQEVIAQYQKFLKLCNHRPSHFDGHQHIQTLRPVAKVLIELFSATSDHRHIRWTRLPQSSQTELKFFEKYSEQQANFLRRVNFEAQNLCSIYKSAGLSTPHAFMGTGLMGSAMSTHGIVMCLLGILDEHKCHLPDTDFKISVEFMVHCGYSSTPSSEIHDQRMISGCGEGPDDFSLSHDREHELNVLCSTLEEIEVLLRQDDRVLNVALVTYHELEKL